jgi:hypothetical protein
MPSVLVPLSRLSTGHAGLLAAENFTDPKNARIVYLAAGGLALLGVLMLLATIAWWRNSRVEHPALAPLEVMGDRRFGKAPDGEQRRLLDDVRPEGAKPLPVARPEPVDLRAPRVDSVTFDDLRDAHSESMAALARATKGIVKPVEPVLPDFAALLDAHPVQPVAPAAVDDETDLVARPIDPLLPRLDSSDA